MIAITMDDTMGPTETGGGGDGRQTGHWHRGGASMEALHAAALQPRSRRWRRRR